MGKYIRSILSSLRKADEDYSLINEGDKILIGVSGGKDSLTLLKALSLYSYFSQKYFEYQPVFLDLGFPKSNLTRIEEFSKSLGKELMIHDSAFVYGVLLANQKEGHHIPCSICSRMKKAAMNDIAKEMGYNKVAFAHHSDDAIETLFMNAIHGGKIATFEPKMYLEKSGITFIRPLYYAKESDIVSFIKEENIPVLESSCPANKKTERERIKQTLNELYKSYPEAKRNFRNLLNNLEGFALPFLNLDYAIIGTPFSLKPLFIANETRKKNEEHYQINKNGNKTGEISIRKKMGHRIEIYGLKGKKEARIAAINKIEEMKKKTIIPAIFVLIGEKENVATLAGYKKQYDIVTKKERYLKRIAK